MTKYFVSLMLILVGCSFSDDKIISHYFDADQSRNILIQTLKFVYYGEGIPSSDRFNPIYTKRYQALSSSYTFDRFYKSESGVYYFLLIRPYTNDKKRAIGGQLKLDQNLIITDFKEIFVTPLLNEKLVRERGRFLFDQLAKYDSIESKYMMMRTYVNWPDDNTKYDQKKHEWIFTLPTN